MRWLISCAFATLVACLPVIAVAAPSFDCRKASNASERAICADTDLAELDAEMARLYATSRTLAAPEKAAKIIADQRAWLKKRAACGTGVACLASRFRERIAELEEKLCLPKAYRPR